MPDNTAQQLLTVGEAARLLEVPVHTVRRWTDYHAPHLSESARPETPGAPRRLTQRDIEVLRAVKQLRSQGLTVAVINERLHSLKVGEIDTEPASIQPAGPAQESQAAALVPVVVVEHLARLEERFAALESRFQPLEVDRRRIDVVFIAIAAFVAGLLVGLSVWFFQ